MHNAECTMQNMRKNILLTLTTYFVLTLAVSGQCKLALDKSPTLSGVRLGMTREAVIQRFGKPFTDQPDRLGYVSSVPKFVAMPPGSSTPGKMTFEMPSHFDGIEQLSVYLNDGLVSSVSISYKDETVKWDSSKEFAEVLSEKLHLPNVWTYKAEDAILWCGAWTLNVNSRRNDIMLMDLVPVLQKVSADQAKAAEKKKVFKP